MSCPPGPSQPPPGCLPPALPAPGVVEAEEEPVTSVICPVCEKLVSPEITAGHTKYFRVDSKIGIECLRCNSEFVATGILSHLVKSHSNVL